MSEQLSIDSQQIVAQAAPQALKTAPASQPAGAAQFKDVLQKQQLGEDSGLSAPPPETLQPQQAVSPVRALPALPGLAAGGNVLPDGGSALAVLPGETSGKSPAKIDIVADTLLEAGQTTPEILDSSSPDDAGTSLISSEAPPQAAIDNSRTTLLANVLAIQAATAAATGQPVDATNTVASQAANAVAGAGSGAVSAVVSAAVPGAVASKAGSQTAALEPTANTALQDIVSAQQESSRALDKRVETAQLQPSSSLPASLTPQQSSIATYNAVAHNSGAALPVGTGAPSAQPLQTLDINIPLQSPDWGRAFSERAVLMVNNQQSAQLRITPASLGQIDIQIKVKDDDASIIIHTQNGLVKETVEAALPRLREMLESQGLNLLDVNVNERHESNQNDFTSAFADYNERAEAEDYVDPLLLQPQQRSWVLADSVDTYA